MTSSSARTSRPGDPGWAPLALLLAAAGAGHLVRPDPWGRIVPRVLGAPRPWVIGSGVAELACAAGLAAPRTRSAAARASAVLFVAVFPANVTMAVRSLRSPRATPLARATALVRLPLQVPLVGWALAVAGRSRSPLITSPPSTSSQITSPLNTAGGRR